MSKENEYAVEFRNVTLSINKHPLVSNLNFQIRKGEALILLGRSGSGKSTTMKLINRLYRPTEGQVVFDGKSTTEWDEIKLRRKVGYVIQETGLFPHFTIERNVGLVPSLEGWNSKQIKSRAFELLKLVGLEPGQFASRYPHELSGGTKTASRCSESISCRSSGIIDGRTFWCFRSNYEIRTSAGIQAIAARIR